MLNEVLWISTLIISFFMVILAYKLFGKTGLYAWTVIGVILANIQLLLQV